MPALQMIPIDKVAPSEDNPRGAIDETGEAFTGLVESMRGVGVLQPILVAGEDGSEQYTILDGHRRFAAASLCGLSEIPGMVLPDGVSKRVARLTANIQREDFSPVAEARSIKELQEDGLTQVQAGGVLGKSERWVRERLRLLGMPEKVQDAFDARVIPLEATAEIAKISEKSPMAAAALAARAIDDEASRPVDAPSRNLADKRDLVVAIDEAIEAGPGEPSAAHFLYRVNRRAIRLEDLERANVPEDFLVLLREGFAQLKKLDKWADVSWTPEEIDQARAFECLLELEAPNPHRPEQTLTYTYITDPAWLGEHALVMLNATRAEVKKRNERYGGGGSPTPAKPEKGSDAEKRAKEKKRREREAELDHREEVRTLNLELGQRTEKALRGSKLSLEEAKLLALLAVGDSAPYLGARGLVYCYHDFQESEKLKNGRSKVTYSPGRAAGEDLVKAILAAKKPEEALGLVVRSVLLAANADQSCVAQSNRAYWEVPGSRSGTSEISKLLTQITDDREVLPDSIRQAKEEKARARGEKAEIALLQAVKGSRAKEGIKHDQLVAESGVTAAAIDEAVDRKWIKAHESGDLSYTATDAGKKRLAALKAGQGGQGAGKSSGGPSAEHTAVLDVVRKFPGIPGVDVAKKTKLNQNRVFRILGDLQKEGRVTKDGRKYTAEDEATK